MILLWIVLLLLLHQGHALMSVTTVYPGEPVTFRCFYSDMEHSNARVKWYRQSVGDVLRLITTLMKATASPTFEPGFPSSRFNVKYTTTLSSLTILRTIQEDEAVYYCAVLTWNKDQWSGTYLSVKGNSERTSDYSVVQSTVSDPVRPGDSVTLQCSVLSDSESDTCPRNHSVYWFRAGSDESHPNIIYTDGNNECEKRSDTVKSCVYHFSKDISSSDAGTYYCAVATCGQIYFGNGTKLEVKGTSSWSVGFLHRDNIILHILCGVLAIGLIVIAFLIYAIKQNSCDCCKADISLKEKVAKKTDKDTWIYSAVVFTIFGSGTDGARDRERMYAAVKAFGLD
ncbi:signal-regulatory protein beta-2-like isoform X2 [Mastacembelus armatus]|uniref:signal-regulatory protein beta-2-like isoform X2 n=1 Tax=Mastacembelus armatus TaxID=205130 RepID=UPI000E460BB6|nr:signal-regulatory protein beta-2-like isoform X2 [Mastacembelus armatus]